VIRLERDRLRSRFGSLDLEAGHLLYLLAGAPHSLCGIEDRSLLLTIVSAAK